MVFLWLGNIVYPHFTGKVLIQVLQTVPFLGVKYVMFLPKQIHPNSVYYY